MYVLTVNIGRNISAKNTHESNYANTHTQQKSKLRRKEERWMNRENKEKKKTRRNSSIVTFENGIAQTNKKMMIYFTLFYFPFFFLGASTPFWCVYFCVIYLLIVNFTSVLCHLYVFTSFYFDWFVVVVVVVVENWMWMCLLYKSWQFDLCCFVQTLQSTILKLS